MPRFTPGELSVMRILWTHGESKPADIQKMFPEPIKNPALRSYLTILVEKEAEVESSEGGELVEGIYIVPITDAVKAAYGLPENITGVAIKRIDEGSGFESHLHEGMVILEINGQVVNNRQDALASLLSGVNKLYIYDRGRTGFLAIRLP